MSLLKLFQDYNNLPESDFNNAFNDVYKNNGYSLGQARVKAENDVNEARIARARAKSVDGCNQIQIMFAKNVR